MYILLTGGFMLLDILTGLVKAFKEKKYTSTVMREGLFHKCALILCIVFGLLVDYAQEFMDLGVTAPITMVICVYICLMECGSIIENISGINHEIVPDKLKSYFAKLSK